MSHIGDAKAALGIQRGDLVQGDDGLYFERTAETVDERNRNKKLGLDVKAELQDSEEVADAMKDIEDTDDAWANWSLKVSVDEEGERMLEMYRQPALSQSSGSMKIEGGVETEESAKPASNEAMGFLQCCYDRCDAEIRSCRATMKGIRQVTPTSSSVVPNSVLRNYKFTFYFP